MSQYNVGDAVRVAAGVKRVAGQPGFVVIVNETGGPLIEGVPPETTLAQRDVLPRHPEYGVVLTIHRPRFRPDRPGELSYESSAVTWFAPHELTSRSNGR